MPDPIEGLHQFLAAQPSVTALVGTNIFDMELPVDDDITMSKKCIVIKPHGGPAGPDTLYINVSRILLQCFGETPHLAYVVHWAAYLALKAMVPSVWAKTYIHNAIPAGGPIPGRDPILQWPYSTAMYLVKVSDMAIP